jgi:hypothetical protein
MDDSADKKQEKVFVVAGFLGRSEVVFEAERYWENRLRADGIAYFRSNECHTLTGEFEKLVDQYGKEDARKKADALLDDLWPIIRSANLYGFCFLGSMPAYKSVQQEPYSEYVFERDPYVQVHEHLIYNVARWVCNNQKPPEPVAFVFDEHNKAARLEGRWSEVKVNSPAAAPCMGTLAPLDDRISPAIQMGDLLANTTQHVFKDRVTTDPRAAFKDLEMACGKNLKWIAAWDENYLRELRDVSIDVATTPTHAFEFTADKILPQ